jgi:hypothetical protein
MEISKEISALEADKNLEEEKFSEEKQNLTYLS